MQKSREYREWEAAADLCSVNASAFENFAEIPYGESERLFGLPVCCKAGMVVSAILRDSTRWDANFYAEAEAIIRRELQFWGDL